MTAPIFSLARLRRLAITVVTVVGLAAVAAPPTASAAAPGRDGIIKVRSVYAFDETVARLRADIDKKGIMFFTAIDQRKLGAEAKIGLRPSTLLLFGNPPLGIKFLTANPNAGLDWPVRLLVTQDERGEVWATYTDFAWLAHRHRISTRPAEFKMAAEVIASITSSVTK